jgi:hypothetical protein
MNKFDQLMRAENELEFFFILINAVKGDLHRARDAAHGNGIKLTVEQNLFWEEPNRKVFERKTTHVFSLFQDGTLTWAMLGQPTITGLHDIRATLAQFRGSLFQTRLPEQT